MVKWLIDLLSGNAGAQLAGGAVNTVAALAVLGPAAIWFTQHKDEVFVVLSYGDTAVIGAIICAVLKAAHYAKPPGA